MAKFLLKASYTTDGVKGVMMDGGTGRRDAVQKLIEGAGGKMEAFYFAFGDADVYVIADLPDNQAAISASLNITAAGGARFATIILLTPEEFDGAVGKSIDYKAPGA